MTVDISVVIPALNAAWCIQDQLDALRGQLTSRTFEVIVADNGSTDDTVEIARDTGARVVDAAAFPGPGAARNVGARAAAGEILVFLDADDVVEPDYLDRITAALDDVDLVGARVEQRLLNPGWSSDVRTIAQNDELPRIENSARDSDIRWIYCATLALRRSTFERLGGFDSQLLAAEDVDLCLRAHAAGMTLGFAGDAVVHCRLRRSLFGIFRQGMVYGMGGAMIDTKYRRLGQPVEHVVDGERGLAHFLLSPIALLLRARDRGHVGEGVFLLGRRLGYVRTVLAANSYQVDYERTSVVASMLAVALMI